MHPGFLFLFAFFLGACASPELHTVAEESNPLTRNGHAVFSEDARLDAELEASLQAFLLELKIGVDLPRGLMADHPDRYAFWYRSLKRVAGPGSQSRASLLKCYPLEDDDLLVTLAFQEQGRIEMILEVLATPRAEGQGFLFGCPFESNTSRLQVTRIGNVVYHHQGALDPELASGFDAFRNGFTPPLTHDPEPLHYYCLDTLEDLLACYGLTFDARKCNWLRHDLGFLDDGDARFITGTGNPDYRFGFLQYALPLAPDFGEDLPLHFTVGIATFFGGYGLSGDDLPTLKAQFREALAADPELDFLVEFRKQRGSSIQRHFTYFVISAFLFEEAIDRVGMEGAMELARCGKDGERFFTQLEKTFGVEEAGFHDLVVAMIRA